MKDEGGNDLADTTTDAKTTTTEVTEQPPVVKREPASDEELAELIQAELTGDLSQVASVTVHQKLFPGALMSSRFETMFRRLVNEKLDPPKAEEKAAE